MRKKKKKKAPLLKTQALLKSKIKLIHTRNNFKIRWTTILTNHRISRWELNPQKPEDSDKEWKTPKVENILHKKIKQEEGTKDKETLDQGLVATPSPSTTPPIMVPVYGPTTCSMSNPKGEHRFRVNHTTSVTSGTQENQRQVASQSKDNPEQTPTENKIETQRIQTRRRYQFERGTKVSSSSKTKVPICMEEDDNKLGSVPDMVLTDLGSLVKLKKVNTETCPEIHFFIRMILERGRPPEEWFRVFFPFERLADPLTRSAL